MNHAHKGQVILAIYPTSMGLGYCVFDTPRRLLDWGYSDIRICKTERTLKKLKALIDLYRPELLILEDATEDTSRRKDRIKKLIHAMTARAVELDTPVKHYTHEQVAQVFGAPNRYTRARDISKVLPDLEPYLPPRCRIWESLHPRMQIFDAVALALTFFYLDT